MENVILFGCGYGRKVFQKIKGQKNVICYVDNNPSMTKELLDGIPVRSPREINDLVYERIYITTVTGMREVHAQLIAMGVAEDVIDDRYVINMVRPREAFLESLGREMYRIGLNGAVAEAGVFRGEFSKLINKIFYDRKLYLFDTFTSFPERDLFTESSAAINARIRNVNFTAPSVELVMNKMSHPENCEVHIGCFPESAATVKDSFCFVSLDMDLYQPTLEGLRFFAPQMVKGGVILLHDYFHQDIYTKVKQAVWDYEAETEITLQKVPIGDEFSIAILF